MSLIANSKYGDCTRCPEKNTQCRKRGKDLVCLLCCRTEDVEKQLAKQKDKAKLQRTLSSLKSIPENKVAVRNKTELDKWFLDRRNEMTGFCVCGCGQKSSKDDDRYFKYSAAHVLGKAKFPSIATHSQNSIELAFWGGCHTTFDDKGYAYCKETNPILWEIVVRKFKILFSSIAENEIKFIPDVLMETLQDTSLVLEG